MVINYCITKSVWAGRVNSGWEYPDHTFSNCRYCFFPRMTDQNQLNEGQLGKFFENRRNTTEDELKQLREVGKVKVALTFNKESWARIAVNLLNLELKKKYMSELEETDPQTQDALSNSKSSSVVGWRGYLSESKARKSLSKEMEELNKLR